MSSPEMHSDRDYLVVEANDPSMLSRVVNNYMRVHGWRPQGGIQVVKTPMGAGNLYVQAMVKHDAETEQRLRNLQEKVDCLCAELTTGGLQ